jgi:hypothetical protein
MFLLIFGLSGILSCVTEQEPAHDPVDTTDSEQAVSTSAGSPALPGDDGTQDSNVLVPPELTPAGPICDIVTSCVRCRRPNGNVSHKRCILHSNCVTTCQACGSC